MAAIGDQLLDQRGPGSILISNLLLPRYTIERGRRVPLTGDKEFESPSSATGELCRHSAGCVDHRIHLPSTLGGTRVRIPLPPARSLLRTAIEAINARIVPDLAARSPRSDRCPRRAPEDHRAVGRALSRKPVRANYRSEIGSRYGSTLVPSASVSACDHPTCDLAVSALHSELPRRGGSSGRARPGDLYETVRRWVLKFGPLIARNLRQSRPRPSERWHLDEMVVRIAGKRMYLWRAVDHEGEILDMLVQRRRDT
jgi:hypothetical protein